MRISEILTHKEHSGVVTVAPEDSVRTLLGLLATHRIGACVVSSDGQHLAGIVSERDIVRRLGDDEGLLAAQVSTIMTPAVVTCTPRATVDEMMSVMTERRIRHVPVVEAPEDDPSAPGDGAGPVVLGIVSIGDLVKSRIEELTFERDQLEHYVHQV